MDSPNQDNLVQKRGEIIRKILSFKKEKSPFLSTSQMAKEWNVSQATLSRIENGHDNISFDQFFKIMQASGNLQEVVNQIEIMDPNFSKFLKENYKHNLETSFIPEGQSRYFSDKEFFKIAIIASNKNFPVTRTYIKEEYGKQGLNKLEILIDNKVLNETDGVIESHEKFTMDQKDLKNCLLLLLEECYDETKFGTGENWLSLQTESVNKEKALPFIRSKLQKAYMEIKEGLYSESFQGKDTIFIGMAADIVKDQSSKSEVLK